MLAILGVWVLLGFIFGPTDTWQIILQNTSSIQVYITDILLIRQSSNAGRSMMTTLAELQSRNKTCERLLRQLPSCSWMETHKEKPKQLLVNGRQIKEVEQDLPCCIQERGICLGVHVLLVRFILIPICCFKNHHDSLSM
jgi:low-affinity ferrous iron transport protein